MSSKLTITRKRLEAIAYGSVRQSQEEGVEMARMLLERSAEYPETLPCPVILEPGLRFGKGVNTRLMLRMLQRRAERYAELDAMGPEERAEHDAAIADLREKLGLGAPNNLSITLPDISSKAFWSGTGKTEVFHPETYRRWVKEAIERHCAIAKIGVEVK